MAEKWRAVLHDYWLNEREYGPVTLFLIRMGIKDVKFRGFRELVNKIELAYDMEFSYPKAKAKVKVLSANQEAATYDEHIDGMCLESTVEMLRECGLTIEEIMAESSMTVIITRGAVPIFVFALMCCFPLPTGGMGRGAAPCSSTILRGGLSIFPILLLHFPLLQLFLRQLVQELLPLLLCQIPLRLLLR